MRPDRGAGFQARIVEAAGLAPSVHNTQPWRFSAFDGGLDLWADVDRQLPVSDPRGHQLHMSCGAALLNAAVAARGLGLAPDVQVLPDPAEPTHLARLTLSAGAPASGPEQKLAEAIARRHTYRDAFAVTPVPEALLEELRSAAEGQGARLHTLLRPDDVLELAVLLSHADAVQADDPAHRVELASWIRDAPAPDGIPRSALPADPERGSSLRLRDFDPNRPVRRGAEPPPAEHPAVVVILTDDDTTRSWLQAGQALGAVLLRAAQDGVMAQPLAQVTDMSTFRQRLRSSLGVLGVPQIALRLGYAVGVATTGRRDPGDLLSPATEPAPVSNRPGAACALTRLRAWESEGGNLAR